MSIQADLKKENQDFTPCLWKSCVCFVGFLFGCRICCLIWVRSIYILSTTDKSRSCRRRLQSSFYSDLTPFLNSKDFHCRLLLKERIRK